MSRKGKYGFAECGHLGYIDRGVYVERRVLAIGTRIYAVMDTCYGSGEHTLTQHFHPALNQKVTVRENGFVLEEKRAGRNSSVFPDRRKHCIGEGVLPCISSLQSD